VLSFFLSRNQLPALRCRSEKKNILRVVHLAEMGRSMLRPYNEKGPPKTGCRGRWFLQLPGLAGLKTRHYKELAGGGG
jgi:hypothetical protein